MLNIIIVEDDDGDAKLLADLLDECARGSGAEISVRRFSDSQRFFAECPEDADVVFLDICMPGLSGIDAARKIRETNSRIIIVFVTNMVQYAVEGYSVQASDFIVKPATEVSVGRVFKKVAALAEMNINKQLTIEDSVSGNVSRVELKDILYIEICRHKLTWHTKNGNISNWGTLDSVQEKLPKKMFSRSHVSYLVNLEHVGKLAKDSVTVGDEILPVSRSQKKIFYADLARYLGERR